MVASVKADIAKLGMNSAMANAELSMAEAMSPPTITVWIDAQEVIHEMSVSLGMDLSPQGQGDSSSSALNASVVVAMSHYGTPVHITAPPPSETISYQQFLRKIGLSGS
jgi:shikimate kinase